MNTYEDNMIPLGMLSSPHIEYCFRRYNIVEDYVLDGLRAATYDMRIGGPVSIWTNGKKDDVELVEIPDLSNNKVTYIELAPNSLTFVTTIEKFKLPEDIIARYNLKSKWVHRGLLLGTGPIVDPQLHSNLLIPIHNFSNRHVRLDYGQELISVEFTKTANPTDIIRFGEHECKYIENRSQFDFKKYLKDISEMRIESSVSSTLNEHAELFSEYKKKISRFEIWGFITIFAAIVGVGALLVDTWSLHTESNSLIREAENIVKTNKDQNIDFRSFSLKSDTESLRSDIQKISKDIKRIDSWVNLPRIYSKNDKLTEIEDRLSEIEEKLKDIHIEKYD